LKFRQVHGGIGGSAGFGGSVLVIPFEKISRLTFDNPQAVGRRVADCRPLLGDPFQGQQDGFRMESSGLNVEKTARVKSSGGRSGVVDA
jgi:hypothetical protein